MENSLKIKFHIAVSKAMPLVSYLVPKNKKIWVFGAWQGKLYADNAKYVFEYINKTDSSIQCIWLSRNKNVVKRVRSLGFTCYHSYSLKGIWSSLRASVAFETEGNQDISYFLNSKRCIVIQLWHGVAPKAANWKNADGSSKHGENPKRTLSSCEWMVSSSKNAEVMANASGACIDKMHITGYPRNDTFITKPYDENMEMLRKEYPGYKFIIYMPTHRNFGKESIPLDQFKYINNFLEKEKIIMVYKPHFHELKNVLKYESIFNNIIIAKDQEVWGDVYSYVHYFDLLVSDYSSISFDFLCAKKPIVLFTYDLEHFRNEGEGFLDFFEDVPAGPFCFTWEETLTSVVALLKEDTWFEKRERCRLLMHPFDDGKNCERVYREVLDILCLNINNSIAFN